MEHNNQIMLTKNDTEVVIEQIANDSGRESSSNSLQLHWFSAAGHETQLPGKKRRKVDKITLMSSAKKVEEPTVVINGRLVNPFPVILVPKHLCNINLDNDGQQNTITSTITLEVERNHVWEKIMVMQETTEFLEQLPYIVLILDKLSIDLVKLEALQYRLVVSIPTPDHQTISVASKPFRIISPSDDKTIGRGQLVLLPSCHIWPSCSPLNTLFPVVLHFDESLPTQLLTSEDLSIIFDQQQGIIHTFDTISIYAFTPRIPTPRTVTVALKCGDQVYDLGIAFAFSNLPTYNTTICSLNPQFIDTELVNNNNNMPDTRPRNITKSNSNPSSRANYTIEQILHSISSMIDAPTAQKIDFSFNSSTGVEKNVGTIINIKFYDAALIGKIIKFPREYLEGNGGSESSSLSLIPKLVLRVPVGQPNEQSKEPTPTKYTDTELPTVMKFKRKSSLKVDAGGEAHFSVVFTETPTKTAAGQSRPLHSRFVLSFVVVDDSDPERILHQSDDVYVPFKHTRTNKGERLSLDELPVNGSLVSSANIVNQDTIEESGVIYHNEGHYAEHDDSMHADQYMPNPNRFEISFNITSGVEKNTGTLVHMKFFDSNLVGKTVKLPSHLLFDGVTDTKVQPPTNLMLYPKVILQSPVHAATNHTEVDALLQLSETRQEVERIFRTKRHTYFTVDRNLQGHISVAFTETPVKIAKKMGQPRQSSFMLSFSIVDEMQPDMVIYQSNEITVPFKRVSKRRREDPEDAKADPVSPPIKARVAMPPIIPRTIQTTSNNNNTTTAAITSAAIRLDDNIPLDELEPHQRFEITFNTVGVEKNTGTVINVKFFDSNLFSKSIKLPKEDSGASQQDIICSLSLIPKLILHTPGNNEGEERQPLDALKFKKQTFFSIDRNLEAHFSVIFTQTPSKTPSGQTRPHHTRFLLSFAVVDDSAPEKVLYHSNEIMVPFKHSKKFYSKFGRYEDNDSTVVHEETATVDLPASSSHADDGEMSLVNSGQPPKSESLVEVTKIKWGQLASVEPTTGRKKARQPVERMVIVDQPIEFVNGQIMYPYPIVETLDTAQKPRIIAELFGCNFDTELGRWIADLNDVTRFSDSSYSTEAVPGHPELTNYVLDKLMVEKKDEKPSVMVLRVTMEFGTSLVSTGTDPFSVIPSTQMRLPLSLATDVKEEERENMLSVTGVAPMEVPNGLGLILFGNFPPYPEYSILFTNNPETPVNPPLQVEGIVKDRNQKSQLPVAALFPPVQDTIKMDLTLKVPHTNITLTIPKVLDNNKAQ